MTRLSIIAIACLWLVGCTNSSRIQMDYLSLRDTCRGVAEENQQFYTAGQPQTGNPALRAKDQNAILAQIFSDCMYANGWTVASPGKPGRFRREDDLAWLSTPSRVARAAPAQAQQQPPQQVSPQAAQQPPNQARSQQRAVQPRAQAAPTPLMQRRAPARPSPARSSPGSTPHAIYAPPPAGRQPINK